LKKANVNVFTRATAKSYVEKQNEVIVTFEENGAERQVAADYVLVTVGRRPNTVNLSLDNVGVIVNSKGYIEVDQQCKTNVSNIYAIGDIVPGLALAHKASYEGKVASEAIAGEPSVVDYRCIPSVVFSDPEIASVGLSEKEAKDRGYEIIVGRFSYTTNGRALVLDVKEGSVTMVGDKKTGAVLGAQIVGAEASNLIAEVALAIEMRGTTFEDIASTIHAHPTLGEMVMEAAENGIGMGIHSL
jgi:dihydrolipoamide dehydrogenase